MKTKPTISIVMPVYNAARFLGSCLESIKDQTFKDWELIAIDDASIDDSYKVLKEFAKKDKRIKVYQNSQNLGVASTLNRAIKLARGEYIARMDADDIMIRTRLKKQIDFLRKNPKAVLIGSQCELISIDGKSVGYKKYPVTDDHIRKMIFTFSPTSHPSIMINRQLVPKQFEWYNPNACPAEDIDLYFRLFLFGKFANLNESLLRYRIYPESTSFKNPKLNFRKTKKVRQNAIIEFGFQPGIRARFASLLEDIVINIVPDRLIYPTYLFARGLTEIKVSISFNLSRMSQSLFYDFDFNQPRRIN